MEVRRAAGGLDQGADTDQKLSNAGADKLMIGVNRTKNTKK